MGLRRSWVIVLVLITNVASKDGCGLDPCKTNVGFTHATVYPSTVAAGQSFSADAAVTYCGCTPVISVTYAGAVRKETTTVFSVYFTAVLGQNTVLFEATCSGQRAPQDTRSVTIEVHPG